MMARIPGYLIRLALALPAAGPLHAATDDLRELRDGGHRHEWVPVRVDEKRDIRTWAKLEDGKRVRSWKIDAWVDAPIEAIARLHTDMALLTAAYCLGLGLPFILAALSFKRFMTASDWIRKHQRGVVIAGGTMLIVTGVLLVTGWWSDLTIWMQQWISSFDVIV